MHFFGSKNDVPVLKSSRRMFLRGLGAAGAATAIPFLPSFATSAEAQARSYDRVIFVAWSHGVYPPHWQPTAPGLSNTEHPRVRTARLRDTTLGFYMADYFRGLEDKMSILTGIGQVGAWGHQTSVAFTASERGEDNNYKITSTFPISVDNVLGRSAKVYASPPSVDVLRLSMGNLHETHSYADFNHIAAVSADVAHAQLFEGLDTEPMPTGPSPAELRARRRLRVVQRSLVQYRRLRDSGRLSAADRRILESTMERYLALQTSLQSRVDALASGAMAPTACSEPSLIGSDSSEEKMRDHINLFTQGMACGATRVGYWRLGSSHDSDQGAHVAGNDANRRADGLYTSIMRNNCRRIAELMRAMDAVEEGNGKTLLENSLIVVTSDMSTSVVGEHPGVDAPFLIAGGLGGKFRMGELIDYRDMEHLTRESHGHEFYSGPPHNELLISLMKGFGLDSSDWGDGGPGFGNYSCLREDRTCNDTSGGIQARYVEYYHRVHADRRSPGAELPYFRV
ncbi:MAG: DUF1552 domain-containing protein [Myxococcota bacterium]